MKKKRILWIDESLHKDSLEYAKERIIDELSLEELDRLARFYKGKYKPYVSILISNDYDVSIVNNLEDLDQILNQKFDLVIVEILYTPPSIEKLGLKFEDYCKAGIKFVMPKLIEADMNFMFFTISGIIELCEDDLSEINYEKFRGSYYKKDFLPSEFLRLVESKI